MMTSKMHNSTEQLPYALRQDLRLIHEAWYVLGGEGEGLLHVFPWFYDVFRDYAAAIVKIRLMAEVDS